MLGNLLTPKDMAKRFHNNPNYWAKLRCSGDGPEFLKIGSKVYYEEAKVAEWIAAKRRRSTSDPDERLTSTAPPMDINKRSKARKWED